MHNIVIAGAGRTKRALAVRSIEELLANTADAILTIPLHTPKDDDLPEVMAWAVGVAQRVGVPFNVIMTEDDYDRIERMKDSEEYSFAARLCKDSKDVILVVTDAEVYKQAVGDADEVILAWADEDVACSKILRLAGGRALPVRDVTANLAVIQADGPTAEPTPYVEEDEEDDNFLGEEDVEGTENAPPETAQVDPTPRYVLEDVSDPLRDAINGLVEALVVEVLKRVTERVKAAQ